MISISFKLDKKGNFEFIDVKGHSNYGEKGKDIVCAGVSAITNGALNFINLFYKDFFNIFISDGNIKIKAKRVINEDSQICLRLMLYQIENISKNYPNNVRIKKIINNN